MRVICLRGSALSFMTRPHHTRSWSTLSGAHPGDGLQVALGQATNAQCAQPAAPQAGNGACDQFGAACRMWECPDAFDMGKGTWAFKWSDQVMHSPATALARPCSSVVPSIILLLAPRQQTELALAPAAA